jgi:catechol 2,3-dioxygenase-like lactoylglutathione lyase family enzyme
MFDHISIGVSDLERSRRFYNAALEPLGYSLRHEDEGMLGYGPDHVGLWIAKVDRPVPAIAVQACISASRHRWRRGSMRFIARGSQPVVRTTARPDCARITARIATRLSWSIRMAFGSRPIARFARDRESGCRGSSSRSLEPAGNRRGERL